MFFYAVNALARRLSLECLQIGRDTAQADSRHRYGVGAASEAAHRVTQAVWVAWQAARAAGMRRAVATQPAKTVAQAATQAPPATGPAGIVITCHVRILQFFRECQLYFGH